MKKSRDDFSVNTIRILQERVAHRCSNPECRAPTSGPNTVDTKATRVGQAAHITAAAKGGPRYDSKFSTEQRKSINNAIWLCNICAKKIDSNEKRYPVDLLCEWKIKAEDMASEELGKPTGETAVQKIKEEYEKKLAAMEETLKNPKTADKKTRDEALKAFTNKDLSKARKLFEDIRKKEKEKEKEDALTAYNLGEIAFLELDFKEALAHYQEAESLDPKNHEAWHGKGTALYALGKYEEAIEAYDEAIELKPDNKYTHYNKGLALYRLEQYEQAISACDKAIEIQPDFCFAWNGKGVVLVDSGKKEEAIKAYDKAIEYKPDYHKAWYNKGLALEKLGRHKEAKQAFKKAEELKKKSKEKKN